MTADRRADIRARLDAATPGPWEWSEFSSYLAAADDRIVLAGGPCQDIAASPADAELISHAPADLRWLLDEVERLEGERDAARRGAKTLGDSLVYWLELAQEATASDDVIEEDGDGDWAVVAERLLTLGEVRSERDAARATLAALVADVEALRQAFEIRSNAATQVGKSGHSEDPAWDRGLGSGYRLSAADLTTVLAKHAPKEDR